jgi:hypothetical protein
MDGRTDGRTDRQTTSPYPYTGRQEFFSTIPLTTFAHFVHSLRLWNDNLICYITNNQIIL